MRSTTRDGVQNILENFPEARDDNWILTIEFYRRYYGTTDISKLRLMQAPPIESIRRSRQWLQERMPELRGELWYQRQVHAGEVAEKFAAGEYGLE